MRVEARLLDPDLPLPVFAHDGDAGMDLHSRVSTVVPSGEWAVVPTGVAFAIPRGFVGLVHPRSGLAAQRGVTVLNAPGTVDAGYRGEVKVILFNASDRDFYVSRGDRVAQMVFQQVCVPEFVWVDRLDDTSRGEGGFGSTGVR